MNWGFIGYGRIARKFEESLRHTSEKLIAIASRSGASKVSDEYLAYTSYDDLLANEAIDIVYISTTHNSHCELTLKALEAGKHVLCEKPLGVSAGEVQKMVSKAREKQLFLMEALWSRFLPGYQKAIELIKNGAIGEVKVISVHFGFEMNPNDPKERLIDPSLAAGAVWDVGIYPISLIQDIFGSTPLSTYVNALLSPLGVETRCAFQLNYGEGKFAQATCAFDLTTVNQALISGTKGRIIMDNFWMCESFSVIDKDKATPYHYPMISNGLCHEAMAVSKYISEGRCESSLMNWEHSLHLATLMDEIIEKARIS